MDVSGALRAVVFDFYGTLTVSASVSARREGASRVAGALGAPAESFFEHLSSTFTERATGRCGDLAETMAWLARRCGCAPTDEQLAAACAERRATEKAYAGMLRSDSTATLLRLKEHGLRIGVVSDCTHELPECWAELPIAELVDAVVFSIEAGQRKPHPSLYRDICHRLGVAPAEALYVGDGGSNELSGALAAGFGAVQLVAADAAEALVYDKEGDWSGPVIYHLTDLVSGLFIAGAGLP
jgi:putative hydrolase of the HAD superfamily